jgi:hypothetical protein
VYISNPKIKVRLITIRVSNFNLNGKDTRTGKGNKSHLKLGPDKIAQMVNKQIG